MKLGIRFFLLIVTLCLAPTWAGAQQERIDFDRLSIEHGLSQSIVEKIVQDPKGFMWFATEDGLNRYDGYTFTVFKNVAGDPSSLSHNELKTVYMDRSGILWVGAFAGGLNRFDPATELVTRYRYSPDDPESIAGDTIRCVFEDSSGALWVGTQGGGLDRFDRTRNVFVHHRAQADTPGTLSHDDVRAIYEDHAGVLWVGTNGGGLNALDRSSGRFSHFQNNPEDQHSLAHDSVRAIFEDQYGKLWIGTYGGGLDVFDRSGGTFLHFGDALGSNLVTSITEDHQGTLWIGTDGEGLAQFDRNTGTFGHYVNDSQNLRSLSADRVFSIFQDRSLVLWVGTYGGGLSRFDVSRKKFQHLLNDPSNVNSLSHDIVWSILEDHQGILWIGTDSGGLNRFARRTDSWSHFRHQTDDPSSLSNDAVRVVFEDRDGMLWLGTHGGGLNAFDRETQRFECFRHDPSDPNSLSHDELRSIYQDRAGALWIGTFGGGLDRFDPAIRTFVNYRHDPANPASLNDNFIRVVLEDQAGIIWVGTQGGGLNRLEGETFSHFRNDPDNAESLSNDYVFAILEASDGRMWIGTFGGGLNLFDRRNGIFRSYNIADGLASESIYAMLEDRSGNLWISTTKGLSKFDTQNETFRNFDVRDGLQSNEFNGGSAFVSASGEMFFGGINGFNIFRPNEIGINTVIPEVVITDLQLFNRSVRVGERQGSILLEKPITYTDRVVLSYRDNVFSFEFAALHYSAPEKNSYSYTMDGFSKNWIPVSADRRFATFTGLAPGDYVFQVRGANSDGVWNQQGAAIAITITPPVWATWWFRSLALVLISVLGFAAYRSRMGGVRMKAELETAHDAQMAIMPQVDPEVDGFEISGICIPANEVGGDFFDFFFIDEQQERLCVAVGDVSGKSMKAAMTAVMSDGMIYSRARQGGSIEQIMASLNQSIAHKVGQRMFTALCLAVLDTRSRELAFANAGLCEPLLSSGGDVSYLKSKGSRFPLGALSATEYLSRSVPLAPGDVVVLFSDGIPEARNGAGYLYGYDAPVEFLSGLDTNALSAEEIKIAFLNDVRRFAHDASQGDDMVVVVIKTTHQNL